jgi:hypothetical protein
MEILRELPRAPRYVCVVEVEPWKRNEKTQASKKGRGWEGGPRALNCDPWRPIILFFKICYMFLGENLLLDMLCDCYSTTSSQKILSVYVN